MNPFVSTPTSEEKRAKISEIAEKRRKGEITSDDALDQIVRSALLNDKISQYGD